MEFGDSRLQMAGDALPSGHSKSIFECSADKTNKWPIPEITVLSQLLHMHKYGTKMNTMVTDSSGAVTHMANVDFFSFAHQV